MIYIAKLIFTINNSYHLIVRKKEKDFGCLEYILPI